MEKEKQYQLLVEQVRSLAEGEDDAISVMANMSAAIHEAMGFWWTGFYIERDGMLRLGPFQGPVACYRIPHGRGVCGTAYERRETVIVPDVEQFPGHIACSSLSRSEIVVPVFAADGSVRAVLDIDSKDLGTFDDSFSKVLKCHAAGLYRITPVE
jgi:GAF domain-containing protein